MVGSGALVISESGVKSQDDVRRLVARGAARRAGRRVADACG